MRYRPVTLRSHGSPSARPVPGSRIPECTTPTRPITSTEHQTAQAADPILRTAPTQTPPLRAAPQRTPTGGGGERLGRVAACGRVGKVVSRRPGWGCGEPAAAAAVGGPGRSALYHADW